MREAGRSSGQPFRYLGIAAEDEEGYDLLSHFEAARAFIDSVHASGGKVLVHCAAGINRSGLVVVCYAMEHRGWKLLDAVRHVHKRCGLELAVGNARAIPDPNLYVPTHPPTRRGPLLTNCGFQHQLVKWARDRGRLG